MSRVEEIGEPVDDDQLRLLLLLACDEACFDQAASAKYLATAFKITASTQEPTKRLYRLERLAIYASLIDRDLSTDALLVVATSDNRASNLRDELKYLAIELVLAHRRNAPEEDKIMAEAEAFCRERKTIQKSDVGCGSAYAFADYVSLLDPALGASVWTRLRPEQAWDQRFRIAEDLVHYVPQSALPELRDLAKSAPNEEAQGRTVAALYCAGDRELACAMLADMELPMGPVQPVMDLLHHIAHEDPNTAVEIARSLRPETGVRGAVSVVLDVAAKTQPHQIEQFLPFMDNKYRKSYAIVSAVKFLAAAGDLLSATRLTETITVAEQRCVAMAAVAKSAGNQEMMCEALQLALETDPYGRSLRSVTVSAIRAFGLEDFKQMLLALIPDLQNGWEDRRLFGVLNVTAERDPVWTLEVFRAYDSAEPIPDWTTASTCYFELLPKLAPVDPEYVLRHLLDNAGNWDSFARKTLKEDCIDSLARESVRAAKQFAERLGFAEQDIDDRRLEAIYRSWQIAKDPAYAEQTLDRLEIHSSTDRRYLSLRAAETMIGWQRNYFRDTEGVIQLAAALTDRSTADEVLAQGAFRLYQLNIDRDALRLLNEIQSPWRQATLLESMASSQLFPRPRERTAFLMGCCEDEDDGASWPGARRDNAM